MAGDEEQGTTGDGPDLATPRGRALRAIDTAVRVTAALGRPDLARELGLVRERLLDPAFTVLVIGEFKQGKSSMINALLGTPVCPVDDDIATATPTFLRWSDEWMAAVYASPGADDLDVAQLRQEVPVDQLVEFTTEAANPENIKQIRSVEIGLPAPLLEGGLVLVDTPGVGGLAGTHAIITLGALPMADAVLFVSDASQEYSGPELEFLKTAMRSCPNVVGVMTKVDFYPEWRKILGLNEGHLEERGLSFPVLPISSELRHLAVASGDSSLNQESGFPALEAFLRDDVAATGEQLVLDGVRRVAERVVDELESQYGEELAALSDPEARARRLAGLQEAEAKAASQRQASARWDVTLADGISDLNRNVTHDLDSRLRGFYEESDAAVDAIDPADSRDEYEQWLYRRAAEHLAASDEKVRGLVADLVATVEGHFVEDGGDNGAVAGFEVEIGSLSEVAGNAREIRQSDTSTDKVATGLAALRGSYGGVMMVGLISRMVGMAVLNPATLVLGGLLTVRTVKELRKQSLNERRRTTKIDGQKYIGELVTLARKDNADRLECIRRQLRDRYHQRAREHQEALSTALVTAKADASRSDAERTQRVADIQAELGRLAKLRAVLDAGFRAPSPEPAAP